MASRLQHDLEQAVTLLQAKVNALGPFQRLNDDEALHKLQLRDAVQQTVSMAHRYEYGQATYLEAEAWLEATHDLLTTAPKGR